MAKRPIPRRQHTNGHGAKSIVSDSVLKLMRARLDESGLTPAHGVQLGLRAIESARGLNEAFEPRPALLIPYWDPRDPNAPLSGWPKAPPFYRLRYLGPETPSAARAAKAKPKRYVQPPESLPCAYFPRFENLDWSSAMDDVREPLLITEGELKAAKACSDGYHCIGLGGVWSFKSKDKGLDFLPELEAVNWIGRSVYLVYDSDIMGNAGIAEAANALAQELTRRGAFPQYMPLPHEPDEGGTEKKTGLDDYLVRCGPALLDRLLETAQPCTLARPLWDINERVSYVSDPGIVVVHGSHQRMTVGAFAQHAFANVVGSVREVNPHGHLTMETKPLAPVWLEWPFRRQVDRLTYAPGAPELTVDEYGGTAHNTWPGWGCESVKGDVGPWTTLLNHLFAGAEPSVRLYFERWCAYQLQRPGIKMYVAVMIWGRAEGTGKTFIGEILSRVFGRNYGELTTEQFHSSFNEWMVDKQLIFGDELKSEDRRLDAETLRRLITQQTVRVNVKHLPTYEVADRCNYLFVSNQPDSLYMSETDRRYLVHRVTVGPLSTEFYAKLRRWKEGDAGPAALRWHLEHLPLGDFDPRAPAPDTAAKLAMREAARTDLGTWCALLRDDPDSILRVGGVASDRALWTSKELLELYDPQGRTKVTAGGLGRELTRVGLDQVNRGLPVRGPDGLARYFAVRNAKRWIAAKIEDVIIHLTGAPPKRSKFRRKEEQ